MSDTCAFLPGVALPARGRPLLAPNRFSMCAAQPPAEAPSAASTSSTTGDASAGATKPQVRKRVVLKKTKKLQSTAGWGRDFFPLFERKGPGSDPGWDLRPKSFRKPEEGKGVCNSCEGNGLMVCSLCNGNEYFLNGKLVDCPACGGKKEVTCSACFGTGEQIELLGEWWEDGIASLYTKEMA